MRAQNSHRTSNKSCSLSFMSFQESASVVVISEVSLALLLYTIRLSSLTTKIGGIQGKAGGFISKLAFSNEI